MEPSEVPSVMDAPIPPTNLVERETVPELEPEPEVEFEPESEWSFWGTEQGPEPLEYIYSRLRQRICTPKRLTN